MKKKKAFRNKLKPPTGMSRPQACKVPGTNKVYMFVSKMSSDTRGAFGGTDHWTKMKAHIKEAAKK